MSADLATVQTVQVTIDAFVGSEVMPFWRAVLSYEAMDEDDLIEPRGSGPWVWFQEMDAPRPQRGRLHLDVFVPRDEAETGIAEAIAAGRRLVTDRFAPSWWALADAKGIEVCVATWMARE